MVPVTSWPGRPVPFSMPAAFLRKYVVGGVLVMKVNVRSGRIVISVGVGTPGSMCAVRALNSLQKSIDLTPRAPSAGPTGGEGVALPAGIKMRLWNMLSFDVEESEVMDPPRSALWQSERLSTCSQQ